MSSALGDGQEESPYGSTQRGGLRSSAAGQRGQRSLGVGARYNGAPG